MTIFLYSTVLAALLLNPQICAQSAEKALTIWALHVIPSLFPYMVFSKMLCEQIKHTHCPPVLVCSSLGLLGGAPSGAATISTYRARLSDKTVLSLTALTGTVSPMFFLGTIRSWTGNSLLCRQLLAAQFSGALLTAFLFSYLPPLKQIHDSSVSPQSSSQTPLVQSIDAILQVGGMIICFSVIASLIGMLPLPKLLFPILHACLEISGGMYTIIQFPFPENIKTVLLAFFSSFGGLCILFQNLLFLKPLGVKPFQLLCISVIRGFFSAFFMLLFLFIQAR